MIYQKIKLKISFNTFETIFIIVFLIILSSCKSFRQKKNDPIILENQGAFSAGGSIIKSEGNYDALKPWTESQGGQTRHGDHADVFYQIPIHTKKYPMVFLHGYGQSKRCWQTTVDGREGFANLFLRKGYSVYLVDQPGRGDAGQTTTEGQIKSVPDDQIWYTQFRIGLYPKFNVGVQFPKDSTSLNNFFRMMTPNTGNISEPKIAEAMSAVFDKSGDGIFITHPASGTIGWNTAMINQHVKAIISFEPGGFIFPEGKVPKGNRGGKGVSMDAFMQLTKIPIVIYYGDFIPSTETNAASLNFWRRALNTAKQWAQLINDFGGHATVVHLPDIGIHGNTHFMMSDLNNKEIATEVYNWLKSNSLDKY